MKKILLLSPLVGLLAYLTLSSNSAGYPANLTGSDGGTAGCGAAGCHNSTATPGVAVTVLLDSAGTIVSHYIPGFTYRIRVTGVNATTSVLPMFGFQLSAYKGSGSAAVQAGVFNGLPAGSAATVFAGLDIVGHTTPFTATGTGGTGAVDSFSLLWTAPPTGTSMVKMTAVINAVDGDGLATAADKWNSVTATFTEAAASNAVAEMDRAGIDIYPNPVRNMLYIRGFDYNNKVVVTITDVAGIVFIKAVPGINDGSVNVSNLIAGMYLIHITSESGLTYSATFVKQ